MPKLVSEHLSMMYYEKSVLGIFVNVKSDLCDREKCAFLEARPDPGKCAWHARLATRMLTATASNVFFYFKFF